MTSIKYYYVLKMEQLKLVNIQIGLKSMIIRKLIERSYLKMYDIIKPNKNNSLKSLKDIEDNQSDENVIILDVKFKSTKFSNPKIEKVANELKSKLKHKIEYFTE